MRAVVFGALVSAVAADEGGPVKKVVALLNDMKKETEANQKADKETYDKLMCWCKKTKKETAEGLEAAKDCIATQQSEITSNAGEKAEKGTKAGHLETDIKQNEDEIAAAISRRAAEAKEFGEQEKDLMQSIGALKSAITVLEKHNKGFLQESATNEIRDKYGRYINKYEDKLSPSQRKTMREFLQQPSSAAYQSQSGEIFGILQSMLDEMTKDLEDATTEENESASNFAKAKADKEKLVEDKTAQLENARVSATKAAEDEQAAKNKLDKCEAEQEQLERVKEAANETCATGETDFQARSKAIAEEIQAIDKAIEILDSPEAFAAFQKTTDKPPAMFVQMAAATTKRLAVAKAVSNMHAVLKNAGDNVFEDFGLRKSVRVIANMLQKGLEGQNDSFSRILAAVDEQIQAKKNLLAALAQKKDDCVKKENDADQRMATLKNKITVSESEITQLAEEIAELKAAIEESETLVKETIEQTNSASAERSEENAEYNTKMQENRAAVTLLEQAKKVLADVYSFVQVGQPQFNTYQQNAGGNTVLGMLDTIINDTKSMMKVDQTAENAAQKAYEKVVKNNNDLVELTKEQIAADKTTKADKNQTKSAEQQNLKNLNDEKDDTQVELDGIKEECDFDVDNYDAIVGAHREEIEGLTQAKAILTNVIQDLTS